MEYNDTIAAAATPLGEGGIGIVRISGSDALNIAEKVFKPKNKDKRVREIKSHTLNLGNIIHPESGKTIDEVLLSIMLGPHSYTAEDVVEINCHGGVMPLKETLEAVLAAGARLADPGEFTKRAFLNGRIDLVQAESIIDIVRARTDKALGVAVDNLEGSLSAQIKEIKDMLSGVLAKIEVNIDFPDEDPEAYLEMSELQGELEEVISRLEEILDAARHGKVLREGVKTVIAGKPNVGKSSLLNALLKEERAIVTEIPGTTRDTIEEMLNINGIPLRIIDTAGIHSTEDRVEQIGVERSEKSLSEADIVLLIIDAVEPLCSEDRRIMEKIKGKPGLVLVNKIDLVEGINEEEIENAAEKECVSVSAKTGFGLDRLKEEVGRLIQSDTISMAAQDRPLITRVRHEKAVKNAAASLREAIEGCRGRMPMDVIAIDIKEAWSSLGLITGETVSEEILDRVFEEFCIGK